MTTLIVVAHPDDEVIGAGGMAAGLAASGEAVHTCLLSGDVKARRHRPDPERLLEHIRRAHERLHLPAPVIGPFPNIAFNTVAHLELVQFIEAAIEETGADRIVTHHPDDLNDDHLQVSRACCAASRLYLRKPGLPGLRHLVFMEVLSSTDWAYPAGRGGFQPNGFYPLTEELLRAKLDALAEYEGVLRAPPHSRSVEVIRALAAVRGAQAGVPFAEAYQVAFDRLDAPAGP